MLLTISSFILSLGIVGFGVFQGRKLFGSLSATSQQISKLAEMLRSCAEGNSFKEVLNGWVDHKDSTVRGVSKPLWRLFDKEPLRLHGRLGWVVDLDFLCDINRRLKNHKAHRRIEAMPGLLMGTGILFTFLGLAIGVFGLDPTNADEMTVGVKRLLGGMSLAFLTSIAGIGTGLWWTWFQKGVDAEFGEAFALLSEVLHEKQFLLIPDEMNYQFLDYQAESSDALAGMEETIGKATLKAMREVGIDTLVTKLSESEHDKRMILVLNAIRSEMASIGSALGRNSETQEKMGKAINKLLESETALSGEPGNPQQQAKLIAHTRKVLNDFGQAHSNQGETLKSIQETAAEVRKLMEGARMATSDIIRNHRQVNDHVQRLEKHWDTYRAHLQAMQDNLQKTLAAYQGEMESALGKVHEEFDGLLAQGLTHFSTALKEFQDTLNAYGALIQKQGQQPAERRKSGFLGKGK
ncbi:MAG: hypothetical protein QNK37_20940 [Acidobacteriota bacterium]|nr:hypothetical protein [Acidobacteriota bacterium]